MIDRFPMWVVYEKPKDFPNECIARLWYTIPGVELTDTVIKGELDDIRKHIEDRGFTCIGRRPDDDPVIKEVWL